MRSFVTLVICAAVVLPVAADASNAPPKLLRAAARLSGLPVRRPVQTASVSPQRYDTLVARAWSREYPSRLRRTDASVYKQLGLVARTVKPTAQRAWYDVSARRLFVQRTHAPSRSLMIQEMVRALVDQNYGLRRLVGLRARDRDRWLAADSMVRGTAALASGLRAAPVRGTPLDRFSALEASAGFGPGRALAAQLRYLGGRAALASALRTFPRTTEQLLHVDKFLEREPALPVRLPDRAGNARLIAAETFGELDVRSLLQAFGIPAGAATAEGWGGGRLALYDGVAVLVLRWDTAQDAAEWQAAVPQYVAAAFPGATAHTCPPLDHCWSTDAAEVASGVYGTTAVFASGPGAAAVAGSLLSPN
jgi:hypothetical protein